MKAQCGEECMLPAKNLKRPGVWSLLPLVPHTEKLSMPDVCAHLCVCVCISVCAHESR